MYSQKTQNEIRRSQISIQHSRDLELSDKVMDRNQRRWNQLHVEADQRQKSHEAECPFTPTIIRRSKSEQRIRKFTQFISDQTRYQNKVQKSIRDKSRSLSNETTEKQDFQKSVVKQRQQYYQKFKPIYERRKQSSD